MPFSGDWEAGMADGAASCTEHGAAPRRHSPGLAGNPSLQRGVRPSCLGSWDTGLAPTSGRSLLFYIYIISFHFIVFYFRGNRKVEIQIGQGMILSCRISPSCLGLCTNPAAGGEKAPGVSARAGAVLCKVGFGSAACARGEVHVWLYHSGYSMIL